jgi:hypothetical protein
MCLCGLVLVSRFVRFAIPVVERRQLLALIAMEPLDAALGHAGYNGHVVLPRHDQPANDGCRHVRGRVFAPTAEPAPAAVGKLHFCEPVDASLHHLVQLGFVEHGIAIESLPSLRASLVVANLLGVEVRPLLLDFFKIHLHPLQRLLRDDRRQEPIERLLRAAIREIGQIGQGVQHGAGQRGRVPHFQARLLGTPLLRHSECEFARLLRRSDHAAERLGLQHAVH